VLLLANGSDPELIRTLLDDSNLWDWLKESLEDQVEALLHLHGTYSSKRWSVIHESEAKDVDQLAKLFQKEIECLHNHCSKLFERVIKRSQDLIQLVCTSSLCCSNYLPCVGIQFDIHRGSSEIYIHEQEYETSHLDYSKCFDRYASILVINMLIVHISSTHIHRGKKYTHNWLFLCPYLTKRVDNIRNEC